MLRTPVRSVGRLLVPGPGPTSAMARAVAADRSAAQAPVRRPATWARPCIPPARSIQPTAVRAASPRFQSRVGSTPGRTATVAAHNSFACAVVGGAAKCWGANGSGRGPGPSLGTGQDYSQLPYSPVPVLVSGLGAGVQALSPGADSLHACALVNGDLTCWGNNSSGQLGDGNAGLSYSSDAPVQVLGLTSGVTGVATGDSHSCAIQSGQVLCWATTPAASLVYQQAQRPRKTFRG